MDTYSLMREFADSWALLALFSIFIFVIFWALRPGSAPVHDDAAQVPFRHEDAPADTTPACKTACEGCTCGAAITSGQEDQS